MVLIQTTVIISFYSLPMYTLVRNNQNIKKVFILIKFYFVKNFILKGKKTKNIHKM